MHLVDSLRRLARAAGAFGHAGPLPAREGYALWADTYPPRPHNPLMEAEQAIVGPLIDAAMPTCALDVGTGTGRYLGLLRVRGRPLGRRRRMSLAMLEPVVARHAARLRRRAAACRSATPPSTWCARR